MFHCGDLKLSVNILSHAELVSASLSERSCAECIGNCPSPREEGVGERVQLGEKINPSLKIVPFRRMLKDNFSLSLGERSKNPCDQLEILRSSSTELLQSNGLSLGMTINRNKLCHPEQSEGSQSEGGINPSPQSSPQGEGAVGRVQSAIMTKCAFTLAEVLITLALIDV